jgi:cell wall-associated NlpC family hydrolase
MRFFLLPACLLIAVAAHAAPQEEHLDEVARALADKGLISQFHQVRQTVVDRTSDLVITAIGFLGVPYRRGGNNAETGFDCSGFVRAMYNQTVGHLLPRRAAEQAAATEKIDRSELKPGDLVFFNTMRRAFSHVGIYVGDGKFIHSPKPGAQVRVEDMTGSYWQRRFDGARRVLSAQEDAIKASGD